MRPGCGDFPDPSAAIEASTLHAHTHGFSSGEMNLRIERGPEIASNYIFSIVRGETELHLKYIPIRIVRFG